jgi:hypothetical protein
MAEFLLPTPLQCLQCPLGAKVVAHEIRHTRIQQSVHAALKKQLQLHLDTHSILLLKGEIDGIAALFKCMLRHRRKV